MHGRAAGVTTSAGIRPLSGRLPRVPLELLLGLVQAFTSSPQAPGETESRAQPW